MHRSSVILCLPTQEFNSQRTTASIYQTPSTACKHEMYFMPKQEMDRSLFFILPRSTAFAKKMTSFELQEQAKIELTAVDTL